MNTFGALELKTYSQLMKSINELTFFTLHELKSSTISAVADLASIISREKNARVNPGRLLQNNKFLEALYTLFRDCCADISRKYFERIFLPIINLYPSHTLFCDSPDLCIVLSEMICKDDDLAHLICLFLIFITQHAPSNSTFIIGQPILINTLVSYISNPHFKFIVLNIFSNLSAILADNGHELCSVPLVLALVEVINEDADDPNDPNRIRCARIISNLSCDWRNYNTLLNTEFNMINHLITHFRATEGNGGFRMNLCAALAGLARDTYGATKLVQSGFENDLLNILKLSPRDPRQWDDTERFASCCLKIISEFDHLRENVICAGARIVLEPFLNITHPRALHSMMTYVYLFGADTCGDAIEIINRGFSTFSYLIDALESGLNKESFASYRWRRVGTTKACLSLSYSHTNKIALNSPRVIELLRRVIIEGVHCNTDDDVIDSYDTHEDIILSAHFAIETLLQISFTYENNSDLLTAWALYDSEFGLRKPIVEYAARFSVEGGTGNPEGGVRSEVLAELLRRLSPSPPPPPRVITPCFTVNGERLRFAFSDRLGRFGHSRLVNHFSRMLLSRGCEVCQYIEDTDILTNIAVICVSRAYLASAACRHEFQSIKIQIKMAEVNEVVVLLLEDGLENAIELPPSDDVRVQMLHARSTAEIDSAVLSLFTHRDDKMNMKMKSS